MASTVKRTACSECGSSNNLCWFTTDAGYLTFKCMTPNCPGPDKAQYSEHKDDLKVKVMTITNQNNFNTNNELILTGRYEELTDRGISEETCRKYLVQVDELHGKKIHIYNYTNSKGDIISQKIRFVDTKDFIWRQNSNEKQLFGNISTNKTHIIYITEGELDALSLAEAGVDSIVSISTGAGDQTIGEIKRHLEFLESFEKIVIVFDNDKVGQDTAKEVLKLLTPGKGYNVLLKDYKDPNEYLQNNAANKLLDALENAEQYEPDTIISPSKEFLLTPELPRAEIPFKTMQEYTRGISFTEGEIWLLGAGAKTGKSTWTKEFVKEMLDKNQEFKAAVCYTEETLKKATNSFICMDNDIRMQDYLEDQTLITSEQFTKSYDKYIGSKRLKFVNINKLKFDGTEIINTIRYLVQSGYKFIVLDHITMFTYTMGGKNSERKDIDIFMNNLNNLKKQYPCTILAVVHLSRPMGQSWEEGRSVHANDFRGSGVFEQICDVMIALERNSESETEKNKLKTKIIHNRINGDTGYTDEFYFSKQTGRLRTGDQLFK